MVTVHIQHWGDLRDLTWRENFVTTQFFINFFLFLLVWSKNKHLRWIMSRTYCHCIRFDLRHLQSIHINYEKVWGGTVFLVYSFAIVPYNDFSLSFQWCSQFNDVSTSNGKTQIPIRLIVPASQCGSLIGKFTRRHATKQANN